jgi:peroxiredoxin
MLAVGDKAPDINAVATTGAQVVLSALKKPFAVVYFFPKAFTSDCTREAELFRDNYAELRLVGAEVIGISTDDLETQCKFADELKVPFPMLADADKSISAAYDVLWPVVGIAHRVTFVIDRVSMTILAIFKHDLSAIKHRDDVLVFLDDLYQKRRAATGP